MATNEIQNGCGLSIDAALASNQKRRCVFRKCGIAGMLGPNFLESLNVPDVIWISADCAENAII